jgi:hypothetical protein
MISKSTHPLILLVCLALISSSAAFAYTIFLKDGSTIEAAEAYTVSGDKASFRLPSGADSTIALNEIDIARTEEYNKRQMGQAVVIRRDGSAGQYDPDEVERTKPVDSLRSLLERRARAERERPEPEAVASPRTVRTTAGGYPDLSSLQRIQAGDTKASSSLQRALSAQALGGFTVYAGTADDRLMLEITANTEGDVMTQLPKLAAAVITFLDQEPSFQAVELLMRTASLSRAGQFEFDRETARLLLSGDATAREFFVASVQF